jgi:hypothetical protein
MGEVRDGDFKDEGWQGDRLKKADEAQRVKTFAEIDAELRSDPQCVYHGGDDEDEHHLFFDDHVEHHRADGRVTRKRAITRR